MKKVLFCYFKIASFIDQLINTSVFVFMFINEEHAEQALIVWNQNTRK